MNPRPLRAVLAALVLAVLVTGLSVLRSKETAQTPVAVTGAQSLVCPVTDPTVLSTTVRAAAVSQVKGRVVGTTDARAVPAAGAVGPGDPYVVTGDQSLAGLSTAGTASGPLKGLWAGGCAAPTVEQTFPGLVSDATRRATLVITNPDPRQATVDVTLLGRTGRVQAPGARGIVVLGNSTRALSLEPLVQSGDPLTAVVRTSTGRVATYARVEGPSGADWVSTAASPAAVGVVTGVPGGDGPRTLVLANPGTRRATVSVEVLTADRTFVAAGADRVEVGAESTVSVPLEKALLGEVVGLRVTSTQPVTAAVWASTAAEGGDLAVAAVRPAFAGRSVLPVTPDSVVVATNAGDTAAPVTLTLRDPSGGLRDASTTSIPPGTTQQLPLTGGGTVEIDSPSDGVRIALLVTKVGDVSGLGVVPLGPGGLAETSLTPRVDPGLA